MQRIGWWVMGATLVAALLGVFGGGPLSKAEVVVPGANVRLQYERLVRLGQEEALAWRGLRAVGDSVDIELAYDRELFSLSPEAYPQPERMRITPSGVILTFATLPNSTTELSTALVPRRPGVLSIRARAGEGDWVALSMIVFPED
jgi:hypothetical protein